MNESESTRPSAEPASKPSGREWITSAPVAVAATGIAVLYTVGVVIETARFRHAGLSTTDAMPLVPIQNALAVGIAALLTPGFLGMLALVGLSALVLWHLESSGKGVYKGGPKPLSKWDRRLSHLVLLVALGGSFVVVPWYGTVGLLAGGGMASLLIWMWVSRGRRIPRGLFAPIVLTVSLGIFAGVIQELHPDPLPVATIQTESSKITGRLLVVTSDGWFLALRDPGGYRLIPASAIRSATARSPRRDDTGSSLGGLVYGWARRSVL